MKPEPAAAVLPPELWDQVWGGLDSAFFKAFFPQGGHPAITSRIRTNEGGSSHQVLKDVPHRILKEQGTGHCTKIEATCSCSGLSSCVWM